MEPNEPRVDTDAPGVKKMIEATDYRVYCFACKRTGAYYTMGSAGLRRIGATMRKTELGYAHLDCLA